MHRLKEVVERTRLPVAGQFDDCARKRETPLSCYRKLPGPRLRTRLFILRSQNGYLDLHDGMTGY